MTRQMAMARRMGELWAMEGAGSRERKTGRGQLGPGKEVAQGFHHAVAATPLGDVPSGLGDGGLDLPDGVPGCGGPAGKAAVEHREVVMMVARRERLLRGDSGEAAEFAEGGSLGIVGVAEAEVNRVAL